mgnify:CR=1 FL=1
MEQVTYMYMYKFYGTISYSGYVIVNANDENEARQKINIGNFDRVEIPNLMNKHLCFSWDNTNPEKVDL